MADRRRGGKPKRLQAVSEKPTKEEKSVARYLRFNVSSKEGRLVGMPVHYFIASDAVNSLLDSKWATGKVPLFSNRASCVDFCHKLLLKGMFHRAVRVERKKDREKKKRKGKDEPEEGVKEEKVKKERKKKTVKEEDSEGEKEEKKEKQETDEKKEEEKKKKKKEKKMKLEMVDLQMFKDGDEVYVWIYDPVPVKTFIIGLLLVLGAIAVCLFPLWPPEVRLGVYYLSLTVAGCIGFLLSLCVVRVILFCIIWVLTFGRHHFWFLPNLNEDVGFFDSFKPLYYHEYMPGEGKEKTDETTEKDPDKETSKTDKNTTADNTEQMDNENEENGESESNNEIEPDNGYEIVNAEEIADEDGEDQSGTAVTNEQKKDN